MTSSALNGTPSDHLAPSIRCMVSLWPSSDHSQLLARFGSGSSVLGLDLEQRRGARQAFGQADVDAAPALRLAGAIVPAFRPAADDMAHRVAIDADAVGHVAGLEDQRLLRQAILDRRQLAGLDEFLP